MPADPAPPAPPLPPNELVRLPPAVDAPDGLPAEAPAPPLPPTLMLPPNELIVPDKPAVPATVKAPALPVNPSFITLPVPFIVNVSETNKPHPLVLKLIPVLTVKFRYHLSSLIVVLPEIVASPSAPVPQGGILTTDGTYDGVCHVAAVDDVAVKI